MTKKLALIGGGGHAISLLDILPSPEQAAGYVDFTATDTMPVAYLGDDDSFIAGHSPEEWCVAVTLVSGPSCRLAKRAEIISRYADYDAPIIVAPSAIVSPSATMGRGTAVFHRAVINARTVTGRHCVVNTGAILEHECHIVDNVFIGPGAVICGGVSVGSNTYIGAGVIIKPGVSICDNAVIGAGAVVIRNIDEAGTYVGVPAKKS